MRREQFVAQLQQALRDAVFEPYKQKIDADNFRIAYLLATGSHRTNIMLNLSGAKIHIDGVVLERLMRTVRLVLEEYLDPTSGQFGNGLCSVMVGRPGPCVEEFTENIIRAAAISGPEKVVDKIIAWSKGGPFRYRHEALLNLRGQVGDTGIIRIKEGVEIEKLPMTSTEAAKNIPAHVSDRIGWGDLMCGIVLRIDCELMPVFLTLPEVDQWASGENGSMRWSCGQFAMTGNTVEELCQSMAVTTGRPVSWRFQWDNCGEDEMFASGFLSPWPRPEHSKNPSLSITEEDLVKVWDFHVRREEAKKRVPDVERAIKRLHRSQQALTFEDQAIELRIALETLFLSQETDSGELNFRLALHAARDVGANPTDREKWINVAKEAYRLGSQAIHRGGIRSANRERNRQIIADGQKLCIEGIKKRVKEQRNPDWNEVILS